MSLDIAGEWIWQAVSLFSGTFIQEDAAILAGAYLVIEKNLPAGLAFGSLLAGVVIGDLIIYAMGWGARRVRWLDRFVSKVDTEAAGHWLERRLILAVAVSRIVPTMSFPTFLACGLLGIPLRRFVISSIATGTVYVTLAFGLLLICGRALPPDAGIYGWLGLASVLIAILLGRRIFIRWRKHRAGRIFASANKTSDSLLTVHDGMPPLRPEQVRVALSERINKYVFYLPLVLQWLWLGLRHWGPTLPTAANPYIEAGGLLGESKAECLAMVSSDAKRWIARTTSIQRQSGSTLEHDLQQAGLALAEAELSYPVIAKPDIGWRGFGVRKIANPEELKAYLHDFPDGLRLILQEYVPYHGETGVFYVRRPGQEKGEIFSLTLRYFPFVVGDGHSDLRTLILENPRTRWTRSIHFAQHQARLDEIIPKGKTLRLAVVGSNRVGGLYIDGIDHATPDLTQRFEEIASSIPEFHFGRFDVRFESIEKLRRGEGLSIVEINGAGAEAIHVWDPDHSLLKVYRDLFAQQSLMFAIGAANRRRGFTPDTAFELLKYQQRQQRLLPAYPSSG
jgi:membrane protein DedA with SNARE-associated domain